MNERGGLKRMTGLFMSHLVRGEPTELAVDYRQQLRGSVFVAIANLFQNPCHLIHAGYATSFSSG
jgi:hypothetical protein